jgi:CRP/FNR family transcriptional regulator, transcriptional activator FtrB
MIQADSFREAVASDHTLCLAALACRAAQFRRQIRHAKNLQLRSAEERVGCYLLALAERAVTRRHRSFSPP